MLSINLERGDFFVVSMNLEINFLDGSKLISVWKQIPNKIHGHKNPLTKSLRNTENTGTPQAEVGV
jgi:hypothetical protein